MENLDYHLLAWLEKGHSVFRPVAPTDAFRREFQAIVERIFGLRDRGLIHVFDFHISPTAEGEYLVIGPCLLTA